MATCNQPLSPLTRQEIPPLNNEYAINLVIRTTPTGNVLDNAQSIPVHHRNLLDEVLEPVSLLGDLAEVQRRETADRGREVRNARRLGLSLICHSCRVQQKKQDA
jgi:hypothetical protein